MYQKKHSSILTFLILLIFILSIPNIMLGDDKNPSGVLKESSEEVADSDGNKLEWRKKTKDFFNRILKKRPFKKNKDTQVLGSTETDDGKNLVPPTDGGHANGNTGGTGSENKDIILISVESGFDLKKSTSMYIKNNNWNCESCKITIEGIQGDYNGVKIYRYPDYRNELFTLEKKNNTSKEISYPALPCDGEDIWLKFTKFGYKPKVLGFKIHKIQNQKNLDYFAQTPSQQTYTREVKLEPYSGWWNVNLNTGQKYYSYEGEEEENADDKSGIFSNSTFFLEISAEEYFGDKGNNRHVFSQKFRFSSNNYSYDDATDEDSGEMVKKIIPQSDVFEAKFDWFWLFRTSEKRNFELIANPSVNCYLTNDSEKNNSKKDVFQIEPFINFGIQSADFNQLSKLYFLLGLGFSERLGGFRFDDDLRFKTQFGLYLGNLTSSDWVPYLKIDLDICLYGNSIDETQIIFGLERDINSINKMINSILGKS